MPTEIDQKLTLSSWLNRLSLPSLPKKFLKKLPLGRILARKVRERRYPQRAVLDVNGVRSVFEFSNPTEEYRTMHYGGELGFLISMIEETKPGDVFFDIGSCVGLVTIMVARKGASVVAFEPDPGFRDRLKNNLGLNGLVEVVVKDWATTDSSGEVFLYTDGTAGRSPSLRQTGSLAAIEVETRAIDEALSSGVLPEPNIVKLDIEGAEGLALTGMRQLLTSPGRPRTIFLELHPEFLPAFGWAAGQVLEQLQEFGYYQDYAAGRDAQTHYVFRRS